MNGSIFITIIVGIQLSAISAIFQSYSNDTGSRSSLFRKISSSPNFQMGVSLPYHYHPGERSADDDKEDAGDSYLHTSESSDHPNADDSDGGDSSKTMDMDLKIPQINFYSTFPNAVGVVGNGLLWFRELSAALGTPLPLWIFTIPTLIFGIGLIFMPDLTVLNLPFFYPNGETDDPLAAFPPLLDFEFEDVQRIKNVIQKLLKPASGFF